jgi:hypothetical protein
MAFSMSVTGAAGWIRTATLGGDELRKFRLGIGVEHAATVKPHAATAMTQLTKGSHHKTIAAPGARPLCLVCRYLQIIYSWMTGYGATSD